MALVEVPVAEIISPLPDVVHMSQNWDSYPSGLPPRCGIADATTLYGIG